MIGRPLTICLAATALVAPTGTAFGAPRTVSARQAVQAVLDDSMEGWNRGDLDRFMASYDKAPDTTYLSGSRLVTGFDAIRATYQQRFARGTGTMGRLSLAIVAFRPVGMDHAYVIGRFRLHRADVTPDAEGFTTLLFRRTATGWRIAADHS